MKRQPEGLLKKAIKVDRKVRKRRIK